MNSQTLKATAACLTTAVVLATAPGCEHLHTVGQAMNLGQQMSENQQRALDRALEGGLPGQQLTSLVEDTAEWLASSLPNDPRVEESPYKLVLVVGGTVNNSESLDQAEVNAATARLFTQLQQSPRLRNNFIFFDRTTDFGVDLSSMTGDLAQFGDPLGGANNAATDTYHPDDIFLIKLTFDEIRDLNADPATLDFRLSPIVEWGGSVGESRMTASFHRTLEYDDSIASPVFGSPGKWVPAE